MKNSQLSELYDINVLEKIIIKGFIISKITGKMFVGCDCDFGHICDCKEQTLEIKGYSLQYRSKTLNIAQWFSDKKRTIKQVNRYLKVLKREKLKQNIIL